jgi:putative DNA primase/helicase
MKSGFTELEEHQAIIPVNTANTFQRNPNGSGKYFDNLIGAMPKTSDDFFDVSEEKKYLYIAAELAKKRNYLNITIPGNDKPGDLRYYRDGIYVPGGNKVLLDDFKDYFETDLNTYNWQQVLLHVRASRQVEIGEVDPPEYIACKNMNLFIDKNTGKYIPLNQSPESPYFTRQLPVDFSKDATCPLILKFLFDIMDVDHMPEGSPDPKRTAAEGVDLLTEIGGVCLWRYQIDNFFALISGTKFGKSRYERILSMVIGEENISHVDPHDFNDDKFATSELYGKMVNIKDDMGSLPILDTGPLKELTGGVPTRLRPMYGVGFSAMLYTKLIMSMNGTPKLPPADNLEAFFGRVIVLKFLHDFSLDPLGEFSPEPGIFVRDPDLIDKICTPEELSGVLNLFLQGLERYRTNHRFSTSMTMADVKAEWEVNQDSARLFLESCVEPDPDGTYFSEDLFNDYTAFCHTKNVYPLATNQLADRAKKMFPKAVKRDLVNPKIGKQATCWCGFRKIALSYNPGDKVDSFVGPKKV